MKCERCKKIFHEEPTWVRPDDIKEGMRLKPYYEHEGEWRPCDSYMLIRKIDGDFIYYSHHGNSQVDIALKEHFEDEYLIFNQD